MSIYVVTVANKSDGYYEILKQSCIQNGCELTTLGFDEEWGGFVWRLKKIREFLKSINSYDIIINIDGFDVIMVNHINKFIDRYKKFNKGIVLSIMNDLNIIKYVQKKMFNTIKYKRSEYLLCGGLWVGKADDLTQMFDMMNIDSDTMNDDQLLLTQFIIENPKFANEKIALDTKMELFTNISRPKIQDWILKDTHSPLKLLYKNGQIINEFNKSTIFVHGPGSIDLKQYIKQLGYNDVPDIPTFSNSRIEFYSKLLVQNLKTEDWITYFGWFLILIFIIIITVILIKKAQKKKKYSNNTKL